MIALVSHTGKKAVVRKVVLLSMVLLLIAAIAGSGELRPAITTDNVQAQVFFSPDVEARPCRELDPALPHDCPHVVTGKLDFASTGAGFGTCRARR